MEFNIDADGSGTDNFVYKVNGMQRMKLDTTGNLTVTSYTGDGANITNINGANISGTISTTLIDTSQIQKRVASTGCPAGSSIRLIAVDGSVTCQPDNGASNSFNSCAYTAVGEKVCPVDTLMKGIGINQVYCCGSSAATCTATNWTNIAGTYTCDVSSACAPYACGTVSNGTQYVNQSKVMADCQVQYRNHIATGNSCYGTCYDSCPSQSDWCGIIYQCNYSTHSCFTNSSCDHDESLEDINFVKELVNIFKNKLNTKKDALH